MGGERWHMISIGWPSERSKARALAGFVLVGSASTLLSYLLYLGLLTIVTPWVAYALSYASGLIFSTLLNIGAVFRAAMNFRNTALYLLCYGLTLALGIGVLRCLVEGLGVPASIAPLGVLIVTVPTSFGLCSMLIGRNERNLWSHTSRPSS